jgi:HAE1 family hydrophobic/amphiphilic exporter-1
MSLPRIAVKRPVATFMVFAALVTMGMVSLTRLPVELMPNYAFGDISIFVTVRGGMPPQEIESGVASIVEEAVGDVAGLTDVISISEEGRCRVALKFEPGFNMDYALLEVRERIARVRGELPSEAERPVIARFEQSDMPVLITALAGSGHTPEELRRLVDESVKDRLLRLDGVANVEVGGGRERKIIVDVDERALAAVGVPMSQLVQALGKGNLNLTVGEWERDSDSRYVLRVTGEYVDLDAVRQQPLRQSAYGSVVRVRDVAAVSDSFLKATSFARVNALPVVSLYIQKESTANTVKVCDGVLTELAEISRELRLDRQGISFITTSNQADAIRRAIDSVRQALIWGSLLALLVLFYFLRDKKSLLVIGITVPVSLAVTFAFMYCFPGMLSLNIMTLSGLALGVGMLVDNAVVVLENMVRKNQAGISLREAAVSGADEVLLAVTASTVTTVVVFLPIVFVNREISILYSGFALTVVFSLTASLLAALTLVPAVYARVAPAAESCGRSNLPFAGYYRRLLGRVLRYRFVCALTALFLFAVSLAAFVWVIPREFIGTAQQEDFTVFVELPTGARIGISDDAVRDIEQLLRRTSEIKTVSSRVEPWSSKVYVRLKPAVQRKRSASALIDSLRPAVQEIEKKYKEAFIYFEQPQQVESNEILVEIYGHDYDTLSSLAVKMLGAMDTIPGLTDLKIRWRKGRPEWQVIVDRARAALFGLTVEEVADQLHAGMRGLRATMFRERGRQIEVISRFDDERRDTLSELKKLPLDLPDGGNIVLEQVAEFKPDLAPGKIWRKNKNRMIQISADRGRYAFGTAVNKIERALSRIELPENYYYRFGDNYQRMVRNQLQMRMAVALMLFLVFLVLASLFESYIKPMIIMGTVPLAAIGAAAALIVTGKAVNIGVLMGIVMLGGIVVNNAIVMVDCIAQLQRRGCEVARAVMRGSCRRLRPVLITSLTTVLGMLPLALDRSEDAALWSPLAITVIGGMISATILTLFLIPALYLLVEDTRVVLNDLPS